MDREALKAQQADLQRKLEKRRGQPGYAANVADIEAAIVLNQTQLDQLNAQDPEGS